MHQTQNKKRVSRGAHVKDYVSFYDKCIYKYVSLLPLAIRVECNTVNRSEMTFDPSKFLFIGSMEEPYDRENSTVSTPLCTIEPMSNGLREYIKWQFWFTQCGQEFLFSSQPKKHFTLLQTFQSWWKWLWPPWPLVHHPSPPESHTEV